MKAAEWNPELSSKAIGRPRKRWEDDTNEFLKLVEEETGSIDRTRRRRNNQSRPARHVNGVRLSDEEVANIT